MERQQQVRTERLTTRREEGRPASLHSVVLDRPEEAEVHVVARTHDTGAAQLLLHDIERHVRDIVQTQVLFLLERAQVQRAVLLGDREQEAHVRMECLALGHGLPTLQDASERRDCVNREPRHPASKRIDA